MSPMQNNTTLSETKTPTEAQLGQHQLNTQTSKSPGQVAYEAYSEHRNWKSFDGKDLPQWESVALDIQDGWQSAAGAARMATPPVERIENQLAYLTGSLLEMQAQARHNAQVTDHYRNIILGALKDPQASLRTIRNKLTLALPDLQLNDVLSMLITVALTKEFKKQDGSVIPNTLAWTDERMTEMGGILNQQREIIYRITQKK